MPGIYENAYNGLAESVATSNIIRCSDSDLVTFNWYLASGSNSTATCQITDSGPAEADIDSSAWSSAFTARGATLAPILGSLPPTRFVRFIRNLSVGSVRVEINKVTYR
ncbi:hypothetical protein LCGC14_2190260 [marine sediment metagenome]|uniref:Uncharacterized protein n=1 Tax=marine sediment metagenome TaxID=412755 RepID=A0A0F9DJY1_9ZZZZ